MKTQNRRFAIGQERLPHKNAAKNRSEAQIEQNFQWRRFVSLLLIALMSVAVLVMLYVGAGYFAGEQIAITTEPNPSSPAMTPTAMIESLPVNPIYPSVEELRKEVDLVARQLVKDFPQSANALAIMAGLQTQIHQYDDAASWWTKAIALDPTSIGNASGLANVQLQQGKNREAVNLLEEYVAQGRHTEESYRLLVQGLQGLGQLEQARVRCEQALKKYPHDTGLLVELGQIQIQLRQLEDAAKTFRTVLEDQPDLSSARSSLATVLARLGKADEARTERDLAVQIKGRDPLVTVDFDEIYRASLQKIVVQTLLVSAAEYLSGGDAAIAERLWLRSIALQPLNAPACHSLVRLYRKERRIKEAFLVQQRLAEVEPTEENYINLASLALTLNLFGECEIALSDTLRLNQQSVLAHSGLAMLYLQTGILKDAKAHAEQAVAVNGSRENYEMLAEICLRMNDPDGHRLALESAKTTFASGQ